MTNLVLIDIRIVRPGMNKAGARLSKVRVGGLGGVKEADLQLMIMIYACK